MSWSPQQESALKAVSAWFADDKAPQVFRLFGYAGTGKSTLATAIADDVRGGGDNKVMFAAFTGKAALVMQSKGCWGARTIHSLIYKLEEERRGDLRFILNRDSDLDRADLLVIDEVSMVNDELAKDLLSFGVKTLVLGDPAQLPPVKGTGYFTEAEPDAMLTEVHRQARDNPIIRVSMDVRAGKPLEPCAHWPCRVIPRADLDQKEVLGADQVLVGLNRTRVTYNGRIRQLKGMDASGPVAGDKLVCLRNNREKMLLNGGIWRANGVKGRRASFIMDLESEDSPGLTAEVRVHSYFFHGREAELTWEERKGLDEFTFGYALTCHKSQGSQWKDVMLFDESGSFREDARRWLYTGVTRAAERLTVVI